MAAKKSTAVATRGAAGGSRSARAETEAPQTAMRDRRQWVEERAYYKAEQRGFAPGMELQDWLEAEAEFETVEGALSEVA